MSSPAKIVMIDDEPDLCLVVKENLEYTGKFVVETLCDPHQAEDFVRQHQPDVIMLDVVMPGREGPEVITALKKDPEFRRIPIIVVSGKGEMVFDKKKEEFKWIPNSPLVQHRGDLPNARGAEALSEAYGVADYLSKPFSTDTLVMVLEDVLAKYRVKKQTDAPPE
ncbi:MAG TPA: response regulator [Candidatus Bathyarchaeia archaeon]|nr:response regulator [Candidatus Bathyarchaeia archaeon]